MQLLNHYQPIQVRYKNVIQEKNKKLNSSIAQKKAKELEQEESVLNEMKEHQERIKSKMGNDIRS